MSDIIWDSKMQRYESLGQMFKHDMWEEDRFYTDKDEVISISRKGGKLTAKAFSVRDIITGKLYRNVAVPENLLREEKQNRAGRLVVEELHVPIVIRERECLDGNVELFAARPAGTAGTHRKPRKWVVPELIEKIFKANPQLGKQLDDSSSSLIHARSQLRSTGAKISIRILAPTPDQTNMSCDFGDAARIAEQEGMPLLPLIPIDASTDIQRLRRAHRTAIVQAGNIGGTVLGIDVETAKIYTIVGCSLFPGLKEKATVLVEENKAIKKGKLTDKFPDKNGVLFRFIGEPV